MLNNHNAILSDEISSLIFEHTSEGIVIFASSGQISKVNSIFCSMTEYSQEELTAINLFHIFSPDSLSPSISTVLAEKNLSIKNISGLLSRKSGTIITISMKFVASSSNFFIGFCVYLTESQKMDDHLQILIGLLDTAPISIIVHDEEGHMIYANQSTYTIHKYLPHEFMELNLHQLDVPESEVKIRPRMRKIENEGEAVFEVSHFRKDRSILPLLIYAKKIFWKGKPAFLSLGTDITDLKAAETALLTERRRLSDIIKGTNIGTWEWNVKANEILVNPRWLELLGYSITDFPTVTIETFVNLTHLDDVNRATELLNLHFRKQIDHYECEVRMHHKNGNWIWILNRGAVSIWDSDGIPLLMSGTHQDITERKHMEEKLLASQREYKNLLDAIPDMVWTSDIEDRYSFVSESWFAMTGYKPNDLIGKKIWEIRTENEKNPVRDANTYYKQDLKSKFSTSKASKEGFRDILSWIYHKKGDLRCHTSSAVPRFDNEGNFIGYIGIDKDITELIQVQTDLIEKEQKYRETVNLLPQIVFETDIQGKLTYVNERGYEIFKYTQEEFAHGLYALDMLIPEHRERGQINIGRILQGEKIGSSEYIGLTKDGSKFPVILYSNPIFKNNLPVGLRGIIVDVSERKLIEKKLMESQKLDAIGQLAAGIAHDFNNILASILGFAELMNEWKDLDQERREFVDMIIQNSRRGKALTTKLLAFGRKEKTTFTPLNMNQVIEDSISILDRSIDKRISILSEFKASKVIISGDKALLQNAIINIGINAYQAMPLGGTIVISTSNVHLDSHFCATYSNLIIPGEYIEIQIHDTGTGISPEHLSKMFEPFFTTKPMGKGTGLGLFMVYGIVKDHKGAITLESELGIGTTFHIFLPLSSEVTTETIQHPGIFKGKGTILLVDDEEMIRIPTQLMLENIGYHVLLAENGKQAVDLFQTTDQKIDLVLLDMIMPIMSGSEALSELRKLNPYCKVIITSGYIKDEEFQQLQESHFSAFIRKPYQIAELCSLISKLLNET